MFEFVADLLSRLHHRRRSRHGAPRHGRSPGRRSSVALQVAPLEERCLLNAVPIPTSNPRVELSTIFWNGEKEPLNKDGKGKLDIPSPAKEGAAKTITFINNSGHTIFPFLRGENKGLNLATKLPYDPQDRSGHEFRVYVGYKTSTGAQYLGLPQGASIKIQVPLALWDGDNLFIANNGKYLTSAKIFNYDPKASVTIIGLHQMVSGTTWVQGGSKFPAGETPLAMFYYSSGEPKTAPDDAPAQLTETTFRDQYLERFFKDPKESHPLLNYDVSYVNNLVAPVTMEASHVPIIYGDVTSTKTPPQYFGFENFGWVATNLGTTAFAKAIHDFTKTTDNALLRQYFGGKGWPAYYNPDPTQLSIPSGANVFLTSPLTTGGLPVHKSSYDENRWQLTSAGTGPITAKAGGPALTVARPTTVELNFDPAEPSKRETFFTTLKGMIDSKQPIAVRTDLTGKNSIGTATGYNDKVGITNIMMINPGKGYKSAPKVTITGGGGTGAEATAFLKNDGTITIGIVAGKNGSGYSSYPKITLTGGDPTVPAVAAANLGGSVTVKLNPDVKIPTGKGVSYDFDRPGTDYAVTAMTNLWYGWAQYYYEAYKNLKTESVQATLNFSKVKETLGKITNKITFTSDPKVALVPGMTVTANGVLPEGTTILRVDGKDVYLSRLPKQDAPKSFMYTFGAPKQIPFDPKYVTPVKLSFTDARTPGARLFAGSVYEAMATQLPVIQPGELPPSMRVVKQVIQYYANLPDYKQPTGPDLVGQVRDIVKSILRGVYDFNKIPNQKEWYPDPAKVPDGLTSGQKFNVFNLDPYVWFVHDVIKMSGYGFSIDDDVANPQAVGPILAEKSGQNHYPNDLQIAFGGTAGFGNQKQWFPTAPWGSITTTATIGKLTSGEFAGRYFIHLTGTDALKRYNQLNNPGEGQVGAYVTAPGYLPAGTTLVHKGPVSGTIPQIVLLIPPGKDKDVKVTDKPVTVNIFADHLPTQHR